MQALLGLVFLAGTWLPEERSGMEQHPLMGFDDFFIADTNLVYDVLHYDLVLDLDIPAETLSAQVDVNLRLLGASDSISLDFVGLDVESVKEGATTRTFTRVDSFLVVDMGRTVNPGEEVTLSVFYHGEPTKASAGFGKGMYFDPSDDDGAVTYTCNAPWGAKYWFPCQDNPEDKAAMDMTVTVPSGYEVISNGTLLSATRTGSRWTFIWNESHPIATYLIALAASKNYALTTDTALVEGQPVPIYHWVLVRDSAEITPKLMVVSDIMEYFSELFYPYPFRDEKYAHVAVPVSGAMENQTCTHINTSVDWGDWDFVVAHEFSHSWWGDATTCRDLKHMWLNEGFASYCEPLWAEYRDGPEAYLEFYENNILETYLKDYNSHRYPILDFPWNYIYSTLTYEKGAAVLHMLRRLTGDEDFFTILKTYGQRFQDSTALSEDFEDVVQEVTGSDYSWFFDQWLQQPGHPEYSFTWSTEPYDDSVKVLLNLEQIQSWPPDVPIFRMPVEFGFVSGSDTLFFSFFDSLEIQNFEVGRPQAPDKVVFDPHLNLVCKKTGITEKKEQDFPEFICSPISQGTLEYSLGTFYDGFLDLELYDAGGRKVACWQDIQPKGTLNLGRLPSGVYFLKVGESASQPQICKIVLVR